MVAAAAAGALLAGFASRGVFAATQPQALTTRAGTSASTPPSPSVTNRDDDAGLGGSDGLGRRGTADR